MINQRLEKLRSLLRKNMLGAYLIPGTDPHQSEYLPELWRRREWITGFNGSAGDAVVTLDSAGLWTDSRYFIQAEQQLKGSGFDLFKMGIPKSIDIPSFLIKELSAGQKIGIDPKLISHSESKRLDQTLKKHQIDLKYLDDNLIDLLWEDQPSVPDFPLVLWPEKYSGESVGSKLLRLREKMETEQVEGGNRTMRFSKRKDFLKIQKIILFSVTTTEIRLPSLSPKTSPFAPGVLN